MQLLNLDRNDAFVGLLFGVFIDLDHLIGYERYAQAQGMAAAFNTESLMNPEGQWKSLFHKPMAIMVVGPLSIASRMAVPLIFWGVHISMDYAQEGYLGNFSEFEAYLLAFLGIAFLSLRFSKFLDARPDGSPGDYLKKEFSILRNLFVRSPRVSGNSA